MTCTASKKLILLTNDDGYASPGLQALAQELRHLAEIAIIAPEHNWSASGHNKTLHKPLRAYRTTIDDIPAYVASGSPSDCVSLGVLGLLPRQPDLIVSGINHGPNLGHDLTYSGTVAAAMEGIISGIPSMAVSLNTFSEARFEPAAQIAKDIASRMLRTEPANPLLLNVNIPPLPVEQIEGIEITRLGRRIYKDALIERRDPRGRIYYWIGGELPDGIPDEGTDIGALYRHRVSVTPIRLDLTNETQIPLLQSWNLTLPRR